MGNMAEAAGPAIYRGAAGKGPYEETSANGQTRMFIDTPPCSRRIGSPRLRSKKRPDGVATGNARLVVGAAGIVENGWPLVRYATAHVDFFRFRQFSADFDKRYPMPLGMKSRNSSEVWVKFTFEIAGNPIEHRGLLFSFLLALLRPFARWLIFSDCSVDLGPVRQRLDDSFAERSNLLLASASGRQVMICACCMHHKDSCVGEMMS